MTVLAFHNVFGTGDPVTDLIFLGIIAVGCFVWNYFAIRGSIYLAKNWRSFSTVWQRALGSLPFIFFLVALIEPVHPAISSLPFGLWAGFPAIIFYAIEFGPPSMFADKFFAFGGMCLNAVVIIGILVRIEARLEKISAKTAPGS